MGQAASDRRQVRVLTLNGFSLQSLQFWPFQERLIILLIIRLAALLRIITGRPDTETHNKSNPINKSVGDRELEASAPGSLHHGPWI